MAIYKNQLAVEHEEEHKNRDFTRLNCAVFKVLVLY